MIGGTLFLAVALLAPFLGPQKFLSTAEILNREGQAVVTVEARSRDGEYNIQASGIVLLSEGVVVTNFHVISNACDVRVRFASSHHTAQVIGVVGLDKENDLALLRVNARGLPVARVGKSAQLKPGDKVVAIGNPMGLEQSVSEGIVSGVRHTASGYWIQTTAPISSGSSGGGLYTQRGELVGITSLTLRESQNLNFAVPVERALDLLGVQHKASRELPKTLPADFGGFDDTSVQLKPSQQELPWSEASKFFCGGNTKTIEQAATKSAPVSGDIFDSVAADLVKEHLAKGISLQTQSRYAEAEQELRAALVLDPYNAEIHVWLGSVLAKQQNVEGAKEEYQRAIRLKPESAVAHNNLGTLATSTGDYKTAFEEFRTAYKLNPNDSTIRKNYEESLVHGWPSIEINRDTALPTSWSDTWQFYVRCEGGMAVLRVGNGHISHKCSKAKHSFDSSLSEIADVIKIQYFDSSELYIRFKNGKKFVLRPTNRLGDGEPAAPLLDAILQAMGR